MTERRRGGRKSAKDKPSSQQLSKEDEAIAKFLRFNCPTKVGMFEGNEVHYFTGRKGIDTLVESKKYGKAATEPKFSTRPDAEAYLSNLLQQGLYFRAKVFVPKKKEDSRRSKRDQQPNELSRPKNAKSLEEKEEDVNGDSGIDAKKEDVKKEEEKKKKKVRLVVHDNQVYNDDTDVYVWVFDPTPLYKKIIGLLIVLGVILACLFPLWPDWLRLGVYYLSVTGISLFGLLLGIALLRTILFGIIYLTTFGRHNLWILPNLTEDCGFFESFQPLYTYEYIPPNDDANKKEDSKDDKKRDSKKKAKENKEEESLVENVESLSKKRSKDTLPPPDPFVGNEKDTNDETDPDEKYSKPSSEENSSAEEDEVSDTDGASKSNKGSSGDSSDPIDVRMNEPKQLIQKTIAKELEVTATFCENMVNKPRRRRVRKADEDDYVMVQNTDDN